MTTTGAPAEAKRGLYCLRCFAGLAAGSARCRRCGFVNRTADRRLYWNRNPFLRFVETCLKVVIVALVALLCFLLATNLEHRGPVSGWTIVPPLLLGVLLWQTASKLTRHDVYWRPATAWIALLLLGAALPLLFHAIQPVAGDRLTPGQILRIESVLLGTATLVHVTARRFTAWKRSLRHRGTPDRP